MSGSTMKYLSIKDAAALTGKSESSVKRFVNQVKNKEPEKYRDSALFRFERLPNGNDKILISDVYLLARFTRSKNELHDLMVDLVGSSESIDNTNGSRGSKNELHDLVDDLVNSPESTDNTNSSHGSKNDPHDLVESAYKKTIEILEKELDRKNKQIDELLERQRESNILLLGNKQVLQLEEKPKRWWQRKK